MSYFRHRAAMRFQIFPAYLVYPFRRFVPVLPVGCRVDQRAIACAVRQDETDFNGIAAGAEAGSFDVNDRGWELSGHGKLGTEKRMSS